MKQRKRQPKFDKTKEPESNSGEGLEEFVSEQPNFKPGDRKKKEKQ
ncbi:MAG: hypothetical protein HC906_10485 [Bacteroidales bacterium]|nr:hypothetical protein [Bacteroidales bacterium]